MFFWLGGADLMWGRCETLGGYFSSKMVELAGSDAAHDILHFQRVVNTAKQLGKEQGANANVVVP